MNRDDFIVMFSAGFIKSINKNGEEYGPDRVLESIKNVPIGTSQQIIMSLINDLIEFVGSEEFSDDTIVLVLKRKK